MEAVSNKFSDSRSWSDEQFLCYVELQCETYQALFSRSMIERLHELAGVEHSLLGLVCSPEWVVMHQDEALPLVEKARAHLELT